MMEDQDIHLTFEQLADYVDGRLSAAELDRVEAHLGGGCDACQQEIGWLRETTAVMAETWEAPSRAVRANVQRAFRHYVPSRPEEEEAVRTVPVPWFHRLFKSRLRWVTAVTTVLVLFLVSGSYYRSWAEEVVLHSATIVEMSGTVEVMPVGSDTWGPMNADNMIRAGDKVRTGEDARLGLQFFSNNVTYLSPNTQMEIVALSTRRDGEERIITLLVKAGEIYSSGWPPDSHLTRLSIQTPKALVAVQAEGFDVLIDTGETTEISVIKGCAEIVNYDAATNTSYRNQTGAACDTQMPIMPVEDKNIVPVFEL